MTLNNVPQPGQTLGQTQAPINDNFVTIDTAFAVNHVPYNTTNQGMHNVVSFPVQNPVPTPLAGIDQLYAQLSAITAQPELVFARQAGSSAPLAVQISEFTSAGWTNPGWAILPSGMLLKWHARIGFGGGGSVTINVNADVPGSPNFTALLSVFTTTVDTSASYNNVIGISSIVFPNFTVSKFGGSNPGGTVTFNYLAIGY